MKLEEQGSNIVEMDLQQTIATLQKCNRNKNMTYSYSAKLMVQKPQK